MWWWGPFLILFYLLMFYSFLLALFPKLLGSSVIISSKLASIWCARKGKRCDLESSVALFLWLLLCSISWEALCFWVVECLC